MDIVIYCTGKKANILLEYPLKEGIRIVDVVDADPQKWGNIFHGYKINPPNKLKEEFFDKVIIASTIYSVIEEVVSSLHNLRVEDSKIVTGEGFFSLGYRRSELDDYFEIPITRIPFRKGPVRTYITETEKSYERRVREGFFEKYCKGEGLDIGYGIKTVIPGCSGWDMCNGDAQYMDGVEDESFDFVYSSHCLEHMVDVRIALKNWFRLVRKGGYLIVAIPHRDLYEKKKALPSRWNIDHKHMFLIGREEDPDTLDIVKEVKESLSGYEIVYIKECSEGHTIDDPMIHSDGEYQIEMVIRKIK